MINLLPPEGKKKIRFDYGMRVAIVFCDKLSLVLLVVLTLLLPSYIYLILQSQALVATKDDTATSEAEFAAITDELIAANTLAGRLIDTPVFMPPSDIIKLVYEIAAVHDVKVNVISLPFENSVVGVLRLEGEAPDRQRLIGFRDALRADVWFAAVNLPNSNLVDTFDISFTIDITPSEVLTTAL